MKGRDHRYLRRIPGDGTPSVRGQLTQAQLEALNEFAAEPELYRAGSGQ